MDGVDGLSPQEEALLMMNALKGVNAPPMEQDLEGLLGLIGNRDDVPPIVQRLLFGFLSPSNAFSNFGDAEMKIERLNMNATISMIEAFMPKGTLTPEFLLLLRNIKSSHNNILSKAKGGNLMKELHTRYNEQGVMMRGEEKPKTLMQKLGFK
jgi:hypothetical protein